MNLSSATTLYAVIGNPIKHSLSPVMHNIAFKSLGINSVYLAFKVAPRNLEGAIIGMRSLGILGFNVTVPHKVSVMQYLDNLDKQAIKIGAVNTVLNNDGVLTGYNTDGLGAIAALKKENVTLEGKNVVLLGAGGAAKALASSISPFSANFTILNRNQSRAKHLASVLNENLGCDVNWKKLTDANISLVLKDADILINATSVGMYPDIDSTLVKRDQISRGMIVFDLVYNPLNTCLLREAQAAHARVIGGLKMLVYQGVLAFELWTGRTPPVDKMVAAVENVLKRENRQ